MPTLKEELMKVPYGADYRANRYYTDDEEVLHLWDPTTGRSYDLRIKKES